MRAIIAVDWGTTNRRAWRVEADGSVSDHLRDDRGVLAMAAADYAPALAGLRERLRSEERRVGKECRL